LEALKLLRVIWQKYIDSIVQHRWIL
jgi:hypothetical protein